MKTKTKIAENLVQKLQTREAQALAAFDALCQRVADGQEPDEEKALEVLRTVGKSPSDLDKEVSRLKRVAELLLIVDPARKRELENELAVEAERWHKELLEIEVEEKALAKRKRERHGEYMNAVLKHEAEISKVIGAQQELNKLTSPPPKVKLPYTGPTFPDPNSGVRWGEGDSLATQY